MFNIPSLLNPVVGRALPPHMIPTFQILQQVFSMKVIQLPHPIRGFPESQDQPAVLLPLLCIQHSLHCIPLLLDWRTPQQSQSCDSDGVHFCQCNPLRMRLHTSSRRCSCKYSSRTLKANIWDYLKCSGHLTVELLGTLLPRKPSSLSSLPVTPYLELLVALPRDIYGAGGGSVEAPGELPPPAHVRVADRYPPLHLQDALLACPAPTVLHACMHVCECCRCKDACTI